MNKSLLSLCFAGILLVATPAFAQGDANSGLALIEEDPGKYADNMGGYGIAVPIVPEPSTACLVGAAAIIAAATGAWRQISRRRTTVSSR